MANDTPTARPVDVAGIRAELEKSEQFLLAQMAMFPNGVDIAVIRVDIWNDLNKSLRALLAAFEGLEKELAILKSHHAVCEGWLKGYDTIRNERDALTRQLAEAKDRLATFEARKAYLSVPDNQLEVAIIKPLQQQLAAARAALEEAVRYAKQCESGFDKLEDYEPPAWVAKAQQALCARPAEGGGEKG